MVPKRTGISSCARANDLELEFVLRPLTVLRKDSKIRPFVLETCVRVYSLRHAKSNIPATASNKCNRQQERTAFCV